MNPSGQADDEDLIRQAQGDSEISRALADRLRSLQRENIFLRAQSDAAIDGIMVVSQEGKFLWFNSRFVELWRLTDDLVAARSDERGIAWVLNMVVDPQAFLAKVQYLYDHPDEQSRDLILLKDGRFFDRHSAPVVSPDGQHLGRVWFFRDITALKTTEIQLSLARDEALAATRAKSTFLANMSHELRTPLNAVLGYSELLQEEAAEFDRKEIIPDLRRIHSAGRLLLTLINDLLDLSKIEAGKMDVCPETFPVDALAAEVADVVRPMIAPGVVFDFTVDPRAGTMTTDRGKVRQILLNVLANAAKFTARGRISLSASRATSLKRDDIQFQVTDTGTGMSAADRLRLFEPFVQGSAAASGKHRGTGLGLAISRRYCHLMSGEIFAESELGRGSTFTITIPRVARSSLAPVSERQPPCVSC